MIKVMCAKAELIPAQIPADERVLKALSVQVLVQLRIDGMVH